MSSSTDVSQSDIGLNGNTVSTLSLITQIEKRRKYLHFCGLVFLFWMFLTLPLFLYYISLRPDNLSSKMANIVLDSFILKIERITLATIPTNIDEAAVHPIHSLIGGSDSLIYRLNTNFLGLSSFGVASFHFAIIAALLFVDRSIKMKSLS